MFFKKYVKQELNEIWTELHNLQNKFETINNGLGKHKTSISTLISAINEDRLAIGKIAEKMQVKIEPKKTTKKGK